MKRRSRKLGGVFVLCSVCQHICRAVELQRRRTEIYQAKLQSHRLQIDIGMPGIQYIQVSRNVETLLRHAVACKHIQITQIYGQTYKSAEMRMRSDVMFTAWIE